MRLARQRKLQSRKHVKYEGLDKHEEMMNKYIDW